MLAHLVNRYGRWAVVPRLQNGELIDSGVVDVYWFRANALRKAAELTDLFYVGDLRWIVIPIRSV